jgi:acyl carrier protein
MDDSKDLETLLNQLKFDFDDNLLNSTAATITSAANTWPYPSSSSGSYTWTTNGTGGYNLGNISPSLSFSNNWHNDTKLKVQGDAEFDGDIKIKGKSITEMFAKIEERLGILYPNEKLEEKWEELKKLGDAYRALEKDILEKEQIWETLKK